MTRKLKSILSVLMSVVLIIGLTACDELGENTETEETVPPRTTNQEDETVQKVVGEITVNAPNVEVKKKISWLGWWYIDETAADAELFKQIYGIPQEGGDEDDKDSIFETTTVVYKERYSKLATMINSGDSPDIFPFEINFFPNSAVKGMFLPIDDVIDTYAPEYANTRDLMDQFMWGGKNYCAIPSLNLADNMLWYRKSVVADAGFEDPYELFKAGKWDWNTFMEMAEDFQNSGENKFIIDGWGVDNSLVASTGTPLISIENGKLKSNLYHANVERAMEMITTLQVENYRYDRATLNGFNVNPMEWANGSTLFFADGPWMMQETLPKFIKRFGWDKEDIFFVPTPKDPNSDEHYVVMKQDALMRVNGSDNLEGFKAWQACVIAAANDEATRLAMREKNKRDYAWTDAQLDFVDELTREGAVKAIFDFKNGIGEDLGDTSMAEAPIESLTKIPYMNGESSFSQLRESYAGLIDARLDEFNASVAS